MVDVERLMAVNVRLNERVQELHDKLTEATNNEAHLYVLVSDLIDPWLDLNRRFAEVVAYIKETT